MPQKYSFKIPVLIFFNKKRQKVVQPLEFSN